MSRLADNPYVGPRTFTEAEREFFFGREREARDLLSLTLSERLVLFYAQSGAGKSSLINTRLRPGLQAEGFEVLPIGRVSGSLPAEIKAVENIFSFNLILKLDQNRQDPAALTHLTLTDYLKTDGATQAQASGRVLIIDQFEEILTTNLDHWDKREAFFSQLRQAMQAHPWLWLVLAMREDYVASLDPYTGLLPGRLETRYYMQRLSHKAALEAIIRPAEKGGCPFAEGVAETLVKNLSEIRTPGQVGTYSGEFVEPVQLQVVCYQLWEDLKRLELPPAQITEKYLPLGYIDRALTQFYESTLAEVSRKTGEPERSLRYWFKEKLITEAKTRATVRRGQDETEGLANLAVDLLVDGFLLRREIRASGILYELVHDRFIEPILNANQAWELRQSQRMGSVNISEISGTTISLGDIITGSVVSSDIAGRDIISNISYIVDRSLSAAEEAARNRAFVTQKLAESVRDYAQRLRAVATEIDAKVSNPYKGLLSYNTSDARLFFGREQAIAELLRHGQGGPLTILHAETGAGKSSLLRAGIVPALLISGNLPIYLRPYNLSPSLAIKRTLLPNLEEFPDLTLLSLHDFLRQVTTILGATPLYLLLDQFEEFFTLLDEATQASFVADLAGCLGDTTLSARWIVALRSEFFSNLASFRPQINPFENEFRLKHLSLAEAQMAITEPAARQGAAFEAGLADLLLADLNVGGQVIPSQLQLVCSVLYDALLAQSSKGMIITQQMYEAEGRAEGILANHLNRVLRTLPTSQERNLARRLLTTLVSSDKRRLRRTRSDMATYLPGVENLDGLLTHLVESRLLNVIEDEETGQPSYELAHDYLLAQIELDPETQARKAAQELLAQETEAFRRYGTLLSPAKFSIINSQREALVLDDAAVELLRRSQESLEAEVQEKEAQRQRELEQQRALAEEQRQRAEEQTKAALRQRMLTRVASWIGVLAIIAAVVALVSWVQSRQSAAEAIAARQRADAQSVLAIAGQKTAEALVAELDATAKAASTGVLVQEEEAVSARGTALAAQNLAQTEATAAAGVRADLAEILEVQLTAAAATTTWLNQDDDGDGLLNGDELNIYNTSTDKSDTDGDGLRDGQEVLEFGTNPLEVDTDADDLPDGVEVEQGWNPLNRDSDGDGIPDGADSNPGEWVAVTEFTPSPTPNQTATQAALMNVEAAATQLSQILATQTDTARPTSTPRPIPTPRPTPTPSLLQPTPIPVAFSSPGRLAFVSNHLTLEQGKFDTYLMEVNGRGQWLLATDLQLDPDSPSLSYSPKTEMLVFARKDSNNHLSLAALQVGGKGSLNLGGCQWQTKDNWQPAISPDGSRIAFVSNCEGNVEIYSMKFDGSDLTWLKTHPDGGYMPSWSPDGKRLAFVSKPETEGQSEIWLIGVDGTGLTRLTFNEEGDDVYPAWSPDGQKIAFASQQKGRLDIYVIDVNNPRLLQNLTDSPFPNNFPVWSLDGAWLAFSRYTTNNEIFIMRADGSELTQLTFDIAIDFYPVWVK